MLFLNFRSDRARQLTRAFIEHGFNRFRAGRRALAIGLCDDHEYAAISTPVVLLARRNLKMTWVTISHGRAMTQLRIAETEKYAHVTFFFSGGREEPFPGEERMLVASPEVATYDLKPEMSAPELTDKLVEAIRLGQI